MKAQLINYGDATRVVYDAAGRSVVVPIGCVKSADLNEATHARILQRQHKDTLVFVTGDTEMSHELQQLMDYLSDYDAVSYDNALSFSDSVLGPGALGIRPDKRVIRMALARRAADLAAGRSVTETTVDKAMAADLAAGITGGLVQEYEEPSEEDYDFSQETDEASPPAPPQIKER